MIRVKVKSLVMDEKTKSPVVLLQEASGNRIMPIWIGPLEAGAIAMGIAGRRFPRPLTHDLMASLLSGLKATVVKIVISDLKDNTFFADIFVERHGEVFRIDARPSDSIALAIRVKAPIFVAEKLFDGQRIAGSEELKKKSEEDKAEELRRFLEDLHPEDFDKLQP
jgi:bifunctional DNase/RNase